MATLTPYKRKFAEEAIEAKRAGVTYTAFAEQKEIPYSSLWRWIKIVEKEQSK